MTALIGWMIGVVMGLALGYLLSGEREDEGRSAPIDPHRQPPDFLTTPNPLKKPAAGGPYRTAPTAAGLRWAPKCSCPLCGDQRRPPPTTAPRCGDPRLS